MQYKKVGEDSDDGEFGPKFEQAGEDFLQTTLGLIDKKDDYQGPSKELEDELNRMFSGAGKKRQRTNVQEKPIDPKLYLGVVDKKLNEEEEEERQRVIKDYMTEYNSHYRTKSLLEEHQSKKHDLKSKDKRSHNEKMRD